MLRLRDLTGLAVIELQGAQKIGQVDEVVIDPENCAVAGIVIVKGRTVLGGGTKEVVPASAVHSVGPDAVTVTAAATVAGEHLGSLPHRRDIVGRKVVGHSGRMHGHIHDVLIDGRDGRVIGYWLEDSPLHSLDSILGSARDHRREYVRADAELRVGPEIVVVPDDAVVTMTDDVEAEGPAAGTWGGFGASAGGSSAWLARNHLQEPAVVPPPVHSEPEPAYEEMAAPPAPVIGDTEIR